jgi:DNA-directed RNA polymerase beta subunit
LENYYKIYLDRFSALSEKLRNQTNKVDSGHLLSFNIVTVREFFGSSQLSQYLDQTNPLSSPHRRR